jgi:hypothetical protein
VDTAQSTRAVARPTSLLHHYAGAHEMLDEGGVLGKIVLLPDG